MTGESNKEVVRSDDDGRPRVSVVIRCFDEERHIGKLLTGISHQTVPAEVVVVDSGSTDGTLDIARSFDTRIVEIDPSEFSFGRALNIGCAAASGDILVFISAHCYPTYEDWLEQLVRPFEDKSVALVYGKQRGDGNTKFSEHRIFQQWFPDASDPHQHHPFCNNANCAVRRDLWEIQPYDEALTGLEDVAWAKEVLAKGHSISYAAGAEIIHLHDETPGRIYNRYRREAHAFKRIFPHESFGWRDLIRLMSASVFGDFAEARRQRSFLRNAAQILVFRSMQYLGTFRGFRDHGPLESALKRKLYYPHPPRDTGHGYHPSSGKRRIPYVDISGVGR